MHFGIIGLIAGIIFKRGLLSKNKISLSIFGFLATIVIYGGIMNPASVIMWQDKITKEMIITSYAVGIPFDVIHAIGSAIFLLLISDVMIEKIERVKVKYGMG